MTNERFEEKKRSNGHALRGVSRRPGLATEAGRDVGQPLSRPGQVRHRRSIVGNPRCRCEIPDNLRQCRKLHKLGDNVGIKSLRASPPEWFELWFVLRQPRPAFL